MKLDKKSILSNFGVMLKHAILEGSRNLLRSFWLSATAIFVIVVSLAAVALVASLWVTVGFTLRQLDNQAVLYVYLKDDVAKENIDVIQKDLKNLREVKEVIFVDKNAAQQELTNSNNTSDEFRNLQQAAQNTNNNLNFLQDSFKIVPINAESYNSVEQFVAQEKYSQVIDQVQGSKNYIQTLQNIYYWTSIGGTLLVIVFGLLSILIMVNVLRIAIYNRRDEIEIMRLVGATNNYIRGPFIAEGIFYNLIAAIFVLLLFAPAFSILIPQMESWLNIRVTSNSSNLLNWMYLAVSATIFLGLSIGGVASYFATQKYLKL